MIKRGSMRFIGIFSKKSKHRRPKLSSKGSLTMRYIVILGLGIPKPIQSWSMIFMSSGKILVLTRISAGRISIEMMKKVDM